MILALLGSFMIFIMVLSGQSKVPNYIGYPLLFLIIIWWGRQIVTS
jgi:hypothetical protein